MIRSVPIDMRLLAVPSHVWQQEWDSIWRDSEYLRRKYDRARMIGEKIEYAVRFLPDDFLTPAPDRGLVVDIGCGFGEFLELCRGAGYQTLGIDSPDGDGGMGDAYVRAAHLMRERQMIFTLESRWQDVVAPEHSSPIALESVALFNSQGSWEQCYAEHLAGPPHHDTHDCRLQVWRFGSELEGKWRHAFRWMEARLRPGGEVAIYANGSADQANMERYDQWLQAVAAAAGLELVLHKPPRFHRWRKPE